MDTLSFSRADGTREIAFAGYSSTTPRRPGFTYPGSSTSTAAHMNANTTANMNITNTAITQSMLTRNGSDSYSNESGYGSPFGSSINMGYSYPYTTRCREESKPRNVTRPYRQDNDEPAENCLFVRESRQAFSLDGQDRSTCSECSQAVIARDTETDSRVFIDIMSPQRVLRDLIMTDASEPMLPALRDALLDVYARGRENEAERREQTHNTEATQTERTFHSFSCLPYEVRHMVWKAALPSRVLMRDDLCQVTYRSIAKAFRPDSHVHTVEELWQSDLFHVCVEARRVVMSLYTAYDRGLAAAAAAECVPQQPLLRNVTTRTKLQMGLDVLYYPWRGNIKAQARGGGQAIRPGPPYMALPLPDRISPASQKGTASSNGRAVSRGILPYPASSIPYGHWASQLRIWRVPSTKVALDIAWLDKQHPDTLAWAVGVDLSEPLHGDPNGLYAQPKPVPPQSLQVVLADLIIPVRIKLSACASSLSGQKQLLQRHIFPHPPIMASYEMSTEADASKARKEGKDSKDSTDGLINLNGKDFTLLVNLYDDRRIEELLSLVGDDEEDDDDNGDNDDGDGDDADDDNDANTITYKKVVNKSALHRCIGCTRRAWEARSDDSTMSWSRQFGELVGGHLQSICRPTMVVSVVLVFA